jgi:hypothetical protein
MTHPTVTTTDICGCGATYRTRDGDPDPYLYGVWWDHHIECEENE